MNKDKELSVITNIPSKFFLLFICFAMKTNLVVKLTIFQSLNPQGLVQKSVFVLGNLQSIHFLIIRIKIHLADISSFSLRRYNIHLSYFLTFAFSLSKLKQKTLNPVNQSSQLYLPTANWFNNFLLQTIMAII